MRESARCRIVFSGIGQRVLVDIDDTIIEVHGYAKQGSGYGYSGVRGLNALLATATTNDAAPVIVAQRLRKGSAGSPRGAARLITDALAPAAKLRLPATSARAGRAQMRRRVQPLRDRVNRQTVPHVQLPQPVNGGPLHRGQRPPGSVLQRPRRRRELSLGEPTPHGGSVDSQPLSDLRCRQTSAEFGQFSRGWRSELTPESAGTARADLLSLIHISE